MKFLINLILLLNLLLCFLVSVSPAKLNADEPEEQMGFRSLQGKSDYEDLELIKTKEKSHILDEQKVRHKSSWFDGPPRLNCPLPQGVRVTNETFLDAFIVGCMRNNQYDTSQLPIENLGMREALILRYLFALNNLIDVDKDGKLTLVMTLKLVWKDKYRSWNKTLLPVDYVRAPPSLLWTPRFRVLESTERDIIKADNDSQLYVNPSGRATLDIYQRLKVACDMNLLYFPFDRQECKMTVNLLYYNSDDVEIFPYRNANATVLQVKNDEWKVTGVNFSSDAVEYHLVLYDEHGKSKTFSKYTWIINVNLFLERAPMYYVRNLIIPTYTMSVVSFFCVFLPYDSSDKLALSSMALLGFIFLQTLIMQMVPRQSDTSYIEVFIISSTILAAFNVSWSAFVRFLSDCYPSRVSSWIVFVVLRLLAFILKPNHVIKRLRARIISRRNQLDVQNPEDISCRTYFAEAWTYLREFPESDLYYVPINADGKPFDSEKRSEEEEAEIVEAADNWKSVAIVMHRLGALIFIVAQVVVFVFFMMPIYYGIHVVPAPKSAANRTQSVPAATNMTGNTTQP